MKIYLDIDGVLADFVGHFFKYLNLPDHLPTEWNDTRIRENFHLIANDEKFWITMPRLVDTLPFTPDGYLTSRPIDNSVTTFWLGKNGFPYAPCKTIKPGELKSDHIESGICLIDDAAHNFEDLESNGIPCLLFDTTYNRHIETDKRITSLHDVTSKLIVNSQSEG